MAPDGAARLLRAHAGLEEGDGPTVGYWLYRRRVGTERGEEFHEGLDETLGEVLAALQAVNQAWRAGGGRRGLAPRT